MKSELQELTQWYMGGSPTGPNSTSRVVYRLLRILVFWGVFCFMVYKLVPIEDWRFFRGVLANPFVVLFVLALYIRSVVFDFLSDRLGQNTSEAGTHGVLNVVTVAKEYPLKFGKSDFFYRCFVGIGWVAACCLLVAGLYWFFSLPK